MTGGLFSNAKMTLVFAGGVIGAAVLFAGFFAPAIVERAGEETPAPEEVPGKNAQDETARSAQPVVPVDPVDDKAFFGDFVGFSDDAELVDKATGFDPSPPGADSLIVIPDVNAASEVAPSEDAHSGDPGGDDGGFAGQTDWGDGADAAPSAPSSRTSRQARMRAGQVARRGNPRPGDLSVAQMKARLAAPPRVSNAGE